MQYRPEVDGLRAVAVVPVVFFHAGFAGFSGGFVGVDVFFVISGYLITGLIQEDLQQGRFSLLRFYERRARRILPALFLVCLCTIAAAWFVLTPEDYRRLGKSLAFMSLFASNIYFLGNVDYFAPAAENQPLLHTWSLAVEEQFYIVFPLILMVLARRTAKWRSMALGAAMLASFLAFVAIDSKHPQSTFYLLQFRAWELLVGACCALYGRGVISADCAGNVQQGLFRALAAWLGVGLLVGTVHFQKAAALPHPLVLTLPVAGTALLILFAQPQRGPGRLLASAPVVGVGLISYSVYLWHQPVFALWRLATPEPGNRVAAPIIVLACFATAYISWRWVEQPLRRARAGTAKVLAGAATALCSLLLIGAGLHYGDGLPQWRTTPAYAELAKTWVPSPRRDDCHASDSQPIDPTRACVYNASPSANASELAVFGDSHVVELALALGQELAARNVPVRHLSYSGCPPFSDLQHPSTGCQRWSLQAQQYLAGNPQVSTVVVGYRLYAALSGGHEGLYPRLPPGGSEQAGWDHLLRTLQVLRDAGKQVLLVLQVPELPRDIRYLAMRSAEPNQDLAGVTRAWWDDRRRWVTDRLHQLPAGVTVIDPTPVFCDAAQCWASAQGKSLYFDDDHPSLVGASVVAKLLADHL
jgi:peptidoglycan/LPS O-acetylase OafA/YrhL